MKRKRYSQCRDLFSSISDLKGITSVQDFKTFISVNIFPIFKFQIDKYVILDTDKANQVNYFVKHVIAQVSVQNYANSLLNLIRSICYITLVALNLNSV